MSGDSGTPRPVAWVVESQHRGESMAVEVAAVVGADVPTVRVVREGQPLRDLSVIGAEGEGVALIMAAAVARGEQGHTAALNRVARVLGGGGVADGAVGRLRADRDSCVRVIEQRWGELRDALHMAGDAPWGLLVDTAARLRAELASAEAALQKAHAERDRLRGAAADAAAACGVATVRQVPDAWAALTADADAARGVLGGREGETVERAARRVVADLGDYLQMPGKPLAALIDDGLRPALSELLSLRREVAEAREALSGKTMQDAAAEVVAPLREALGLSAGLAARDVVHAAVVMLDAYGLVEAPSPKPVRIGGPCECCAAEDRISIDPETGDPCRVCDGMGWVPKPTREPMTHTSLASIEEHGVVVGDRVAWPGGVRDSVNVLGHLFELGAKSEDFNLDQWSGGRPFAITAVEAPDATD